jgi:hypothetical protein
MEPSATISKDIGSTRFNFWDEPVPLNQSILRSLIGLRMCNAAGKSRTEYLQLQARNGLMAIDVVLAEYRSILQTGQDKTERLFQLTGPSLLVH